ncbi:unnamed protein product [Arabidopsis thaliana]|uniref:(thale cress) hypothetical protein n=1 Tax=Arabidopsis thaliana TaxID=3702 RepID=A0A7G2FEP7_ARATH|nr:unnamed protein product [Arabidopsis thaliana]
MALQKFPLLGLLLVLTILVSSATADGHVCPPSTKLSRRCNNDKENVVVSFFHRYKVINYESCCLPKVGYAFTLSIL